jgi:hypothetical protein
VWFRRVGFPSRVLNDVVFVARSVDLEVFEQARNELITRLHVRLGACACLLTKDAHK